MKKNLIVTMLMCLALLVGCGDTSTSSSKADSESSTAEKVDFDLTTMDGTMVYSTVYDMVSNPGNYLGKTVSLKGNFASSYDETTKTNYFFVVIGDAAACCSQGMEFIWDDNKHAYPDEYPEQNAEVQISGVFGEYDENGNTYYYIDTDNLTLL